MDQHSTREEIKIGKICAKRIHFSRKKGGYCMAGFWDSLGQVINEGAQVVKQGIQEYEREIRSINAGIFLYNVLTIGAIALGILGILGAGPEFILYSIGIFFVVEKIFDALTARINAVVNLADSFGMKKALHGGNSHLGILIRPIRVY